MVKRQLNNAINEKIDIVYLWVNNNDKEWLEKKNIFASKYCKEPVSNSTARFYNNDELKFSLRSLEKYAPWINNVFIVTANQVPEWLNLDNPKIKMVNHSEIMPESALPSYNSTAIIHCIANIKDLSEFFLYADDDMFFAKKITPSFFFRKLDDLYPIYRFGNDIPEIIDTQWVITVNNAYELIKQNYEINFYKFTHHNIDSYRKSYLKACYSEYKDEIDKSINFHFRESTEIERTIYSLWAIANNKGIYKRLAKIDSYLPWHRRILDFILRKYERDSVVRGVEEDYASYIKKFNPYLFCVNDNTRATEHDRQKYRQFLENLYPEKSSFEK